MNKSTLSIFAVVCSSVVGCAAPDEDSQPESSSLESSSSSLTAEECLAQQDSCIRRNPLFGLFTCPIAYDGCLKEVAEGVAEEVSEAAEAAAACNEEWASCQQKDPTKIAGCAEERAECIAAIVGVELPPFVSGITGCADDAVECIADASIRTGLVSCATKLNECAVDQAVTAVDDVIDDTVGPVLESANECAIEFRTCVDGAEGGAAIAQCGLDNTACVGEILDVQIPVPSLEDAAGCAEDATECVFNARRLRDIQACTAALGECTSKVIDDTENVPEQLTCEQKWSACVAKDPLFGFISCGAELATCQD